MRLDDRARGGQAETRCGCRILGTVRAAIKGLEQALREHHVDTRGRHIDADFCQGLMAVPLDRIPSITHVIVSAFGSEKVPALTAILRGKWVTDLVTDIATARAVLGHLD